MLASILAISLNCPMMVHCPSRSSTACFRFFGSSVFVVFDNRLIAQAIQ